MTGCWSGRGTGPRGLRLAGAGGMLGELVKAVLERALEAELTGHPGYARHDPSGHNFGNSRNGTISKKVQTGIGQAGIFTHLRLQAPSPCRTALPGAWAGRDGGL